MRYQARQTDTGRWVVYDTESERQMDGFHASPDAAVAQARGLEAELRKEAPSADDGGPKNIFIPLAKVDEARHEVWGYATLEEPDEGDEIMDYDSSKPLFLKWSQDVASRSGGKSLGNVRGQHRDDVAAGRLIAFTPDDDRKGFWVGAHVVDAAEWKKVETGVYTGFSVGGRYARRWPDTRMNKMRYTARPLEISLVDAPCVRSATFQYVKADGLTEDRPFVQPALDEALQKADVPASPQPVGTAADVPGVDGIDRMPNQDVPMQVSPDNLPDGETLAGRHTGVEDMQAQAAEIIQATSAAPEPVTKNVKVRRRMLKVTPPRMVKVNKTSAV